jgi:excisionase family DNA binding protein
MRHPHAAQAAPAIAKAANTDTSTHTPEPGNCVRAEMLTPRQVAELAQMSYHAVLRAINDGELAASRLRGRLRVQPADFNAWVDGSRVTLAKAPRPRIAQATSQRSRPGAGPTAGSLDLLSAIERKAS